MNNDVIMALNLANKKVEKMERTEEG